MLGYHNDLGATAETIDADGWLHTGDVATRDATGHLFVVDRRKDMIKRAGENVASGEVERVVGEHPAVFDCAAVGVPDAMRDEAIPVYGDGRNVRDWIHVEDHCRAILAVMERGRAGAVYNVGARNERRNIEVAESVLDAMGKPRSLLKFVKDRPGHDRRYAIDPAKIETELGWSPRETWESGLAKTIRWYAENTGWVERARSGAYREYYEKQYGTV